ncbi:MAG TPA: hypothetical protein PLV92_02185, partial [Pirellulaceae bacterium]|nr:hypothetical protein [Pirellulaceae bacterium]
MVLVSKLRSSFQMPLDHESNEYYESIRGLRAAVAVLRDERVFVAISLLRDERVFVAISLLRDERVL